MARKAATRNTLAAGQTTGFQGFSRASLQFLSDLAANNNREWFEANRDIYEREVKSPMLSLIAALAFAFQTHDIPLTGDARRSMFRIYRDVRFSKDKAPYKTNASFVFSRDGGKQGTGIFYLQIGGTDGAFVALGFYGPEPDDLAALRHAMVAHPARWAATRQALATAKLELSRSDALSRIPKGFEHYADSPNADDLKLKSLVVRRAIASAHIHSSALIEDALAFASQGIPLLEFGRNAIDIGRGALPRTKVERTR